VSTIAATTAAAIGQRVSRTTCSGVGSCSRRTLNRPHLVRSGGLLDLGLDDIGRRILHDGPT
jgi:hypothetical protein